MSSTPSDEPPRPHRDRRIAWRIILTVHAVLVVLAIYILFVKLKTHPVEGSIRTLEKMYAQQCTNTSLPKFISKVCKGDASCMRATATSQRDACVGLNSVISQQYATLRSLNDALRRA